MDRIDKKIVTFFKLQATKGWLHLTVPEIERGIKISRNEVIRSLERLQITGVIDKVERGSRIKTTPFYYLTEIREYCKKKYRKT